MEKQLRVMPLLNDSAAKIKDMRTASAPSSSSQDVVVDCLSIYAQVYRETLTPELIVAYQSCLADLDPRFLHRAFIRAMKSSAFRPTPAEVREAYAREIEKAPRPKQLEEPPLTEEDRVAVEKFFTNAATKLGLRRTAKNNESEQRALLGKQAAEIRANATPDEVRNAEQLRAKCERGAR